MTCSLYPFQRKAVAQLLAGKHIEFATMGSGKNPTSMVWAAEKCKATGKNKILVITTASKAKTCFVAGTKVLTSNGEKNIEDVELGERVLAYKDGKVAERRVIDCIKQETTKALYRIDFGGSCNIIGTEDHPFYVGGGRYKEMKDVQKGDIIYGIRSETKRSTEKTQQGDGEVLQSEPEPCVFSVSKADARTDEGATRPVVETRDVDLFGEMSGNSKEQWEEERIQEKTSVGIPARRAMSDVREGDNLRRNEENTEVDILQDGESVLLHGVCEKGSVYGFGRGKEEHDSRAKTGSGEDKSKSFCGEKYPHEQETVPNTTVSGGRIGVCGRFRGHLCADRCSVPERQDWDRDRRGASWKPASAESRRTEGQEIVPIRVENIQVLGQGANRKNIVYCITVEDSHNFFANGVLVHNCDHWDDLCAFCPEFAKTLDPASFIVISWHKLRAWVDVNWKTLNEWVVVADECQKIKGYSTGMGKAFLKIAKKNQDWAGFTGTPGDSWENYISYFVATNLVRNKTSFMAEFANVQTFKGYPEIVGWRNEDKLRNMWAQISYAPDTSSVLSQLPKATYKTNTFPKPKDYSTVLKTRMRAGSDGSNMDDFLDTAGALTSELRRICFTKNKQEWIKDYIESLDSGAILFYNFIATGDKLAEICEKALGKDGRVWRIDGKHHEIPTAETIGKKDIVLCQWQSGSEALNVQFLHHWVGVELCYAYSIFQQAMGRIKRIGQEHPMLFQILVTENTIEQDVLDILRQKGEFSSRNWCLGKGIKLEGGK